VSVNSPLDKNRPGAMSKSRPKENDSTDLTRVPVVFGTAGHIDHGKSALVRALTGTDPDRLKEEKKRGITIELGFAFLNDNVAFIDVPGHERFVKRMVAGAATIDYALLVIAADDGVMPQTEEHLDILSLLGVEQGLVVITKADLVDEDWLELLQEDLGRFLKGTFLENADRLTVDSISGSGIDNLKEMILGLAAQKKARGGGLFFRLPVDRVFTMKGFGTVVTGTVLSGRAQKNDVLQLMPGRVSARVKGVQSQGRETDYVVAGQRAALNLAAVGVDEIERGLVAATADLLPEANRIDVRLKMLATAKKPLIHRQRVMVHLGTDECAARIKLLEGDAIAPGAEAFAQLALEKKTSVMRLDRFVIRSYSPQRTIGGGVVLDADAPMRKRNRNDVINILTELAGSDSNATILAALRKKQPTTAQELARETNFDPTKMERILDDLLHEGAVLTLGDSAQSFISLDFYENFIESLRQTLQRMHLAHPLREGIKQAEAFTGLPKNFPRKSAPLLVEISLAKADLMRPSGDLLALPGFEVKLDDRQRKILDDIVALVEQTKFKTPSANELAKTHELTKAEFKQLISLLLDRNKLIQISSDLYFSPTAIARARQILQKQYDTRPELTLSELKEALGTSRKYAVPLAGHFDTLGWTRREEDVRREGPKLRKKTISE
jgi:selenocysteine-specific elongation factor